MVESPSVQETFNLMIINRSDLSIHGYWAAIAIQSHGYLKSNVSKIVFFFD